MGDVTSWTQHQRSRSTRRLGYTIAIVVNGAILFVAHNVLAWGVFDWLTDDFAEVLPIVTASLLATIAANTMFLIYDEPWFTSACEIVTTGFALAAAIATYRVFPFDFSAYAWDWDTIVRWLIVLAIIGMSIAIVVNVVKLVASITASEPRAPAPT